MTVADYGFETASVDHAAMALLAGGDDLFDLTQLAAASEPKPADITVAMQTMETSSPAVADHFLPERHGETLAPHLLVSAVDADPADRQLAAKTTQEATVAIHNPEDTTLAQLQHPPAPALAAADILPIPAKISPVSRPQAVATRLWEAVSSHPSPRRRSSAGSMPWRSWVTIKLPPTRQPADMRESC